MRYMNVCIYKNSCIYMHEFFSGALCTVTCVGSVQVRLACIRLVCTMTCFSCAALRARGLV